MSCHNLANPLSPVNKAFIRRRHVISLALLGRRAVRHGSAMSCSGIHVHKLGVRNSAHLFIFLNLITAAVNV
jgi:hypothetical protein